MNKIVFSLISAIFALPAFAGINNINYQAVIKDANGVVADKEVALRFEIIDNSATVVYSEEQNLTTNTGGFISCQLGGDDSLSNLDWGDMTLRVYYDNQLISTEAISSVPTALYSIHSADSAGIKTAVEELTIDYEASKENLLGMSAEIVRLDGIAADYEDFKEGYAQFKEEYDETFQKMVEMQDGVTTSINMLMPEMERLVAENEETQETLRGMNADLTRLDGVSDDYLEFEEEYREKVTTLSDSIQTLSTTIERQTADLNDIMTAIESLQHIVSDLQTRITLLESKE